MSNHVHLLVTPEQMGDLAYAMRRFNRCYVGAFNRRHGRTGTLWESRFRSCLVDSKRYAFIVYRYIELNPVRAAMVYDPAHYRWSSARENLGLRPQSFLTPHAVYLALNNGVKVPCRTIADGNF